MGVTPEERELGTYGGGGSWANSQGGSGMNPLIGAALIGTGSDFLSGFLSGGNSKQLKSVYSQIQGMLQSNEDVLPVGQISNQLDYLSAPGSQATAQHLSKRLGISSPLAQAGLAKMNQQFRQESILDLLKNNAMLKNQRQLTLTQLLSGLATQFK